MHHSATRVLLCQKHRCSSWSPQNEQGTERESQKWSRFYRALWVTDVDFLLYILILYRPDLHLWVPERPCVTVWLCDLETSNPYLQKAENRAGLWVCSVSVLFWSALDVLFIIPPEAQGRPFQESILLQGKVKAHGESDPSAKSYLF